MYKLNAFLDLLQTAVILLIFEGSHLREFHLRLRFALIFGPDFELSYSNYES